MGFPGALYRDWRATVRGAVAGVTAFVVGFAATFVLEHDEARNAEGFVEDAATFLGPDAGPLLRDAATWLQPDPLQVTGWFYYASHYVPLDVEVAALGRSANRVVDVQDLPMWDGVLVLVPPVVLFAAGFGVAAREFTRDSVGSSSVLAGTRLALGYGGVAALVAFQVAYSRSVGFASVSIAPGLATVVLNCAAYALAFGTAGAAVYAAYVARD